jgi:hypothetical protein
VDVKARPQIRRRTDLDHFRGRSRVLTSVHADLILAIVALAQAPSDAALATSADAVHEADRLVWEEHPAALSARMSALLQLRYLGARRARPDLQDESGVSLRRARLGWEGSALSPTLAFKLELEMGQGTIGPLDLYVEWRLSSHFTVRAGQMRVPFSRSWMTPEQLLLFPERSVATDELRYDYDLGALVEGRWRDGRAQAWLGAFNGAGRNVVGNDNLDPMLLGRVAVTPLGDPIRLAEGDRVRTARPALAFGVTGTLDYVPVPDAYGYTSRAPTYPRSVTVVDTNQDGRRDGVRVLQAELDLAGRWRGFALDGELYARHETWRDFGALQPVPADRFAPRASFRGGFAQLSYSFWRGLQLAGRASVAEISPLALDGRRRAVTTCVGPDGASFACALPYADRRAELSGLVAYSLPDGRLMLILAYSLLNWSATTRAPVAGSREHDVVAQFQFAL